MSTVQPEPLAPPSVVTRPASILTLTLLLGLQPITTDLYLPSLPQLTQDLGASLVAGQLTLSVLILAFGVAQLFWGPLADRLGRRPVLLAGLSLHVLASVGCALAPTIEALLVWRAVQGVALAAAVVCARALVRDLYEPHNGAQVLALALSGLGVVALLGPLIGGAAAQFWGWRSALGLVGAASGLVLLWVTWRLPETLARPNPLATRPGPLLRTWWTIARHPVFNSWALLVAFAYGAMFTILAGSSFIFIGVHGLSEIGCGAALATGSASYLLGTLVCRRAVPRLGMQGTVARGAFFTLGGGLLGLALAWAGVEQLWAVLLPMCLIAFGHGMLQPCGQAGFVGPFPHAAGSAAALAGLMISLVAFTVGYWLGLALPAGSKGMMGVLAFWCSATALVAWTLVQRTKL